MHMGKHIAKVGFFEPGLVKAADFAKFEPYQRSEFCRLATEAGIDHHQLAEMMAVPVHAVITALQLHHAHNPFGGACNEGSGPAKLEPVSLKNKIIVLSFIAEAPSGSITITINNLAREVKVRRGTVVAVLRNLRVSGYVEQARDGKGKVPSVFRLTLKGEAALSRWKEAA
jgi:hypothetical protein